MSKSAPAEPTEPGAIVVICQGPPRCTDEQAAVAALQDQGCPWCRRITVHADGTQTETGPIEA